MGSIAIGTHGMDGWTDQQVQYGDLGYIPGLPAPASNIRKSRSGETGNEAGKSPVPKKIDAFVR